MSATITRQAARSALRPDQEQEFAAYALWIEGLRLPTHEKIVALAVAREHAMGHGEPSISDEVAKGAGLSMRAFMRALAKLERRGVVDIGHYTTGSLTLSMEQHQELERIVAAARRRTRR
jgi:hypothetical protein